MSNSSGIVLDLDFAEKSGAVAGDASRYGNDGTLTGCKWVENGLEFNGSSDRVDCGNDVSLTPSRLTVSMWFKKYSDHVGVLIGAKWAETAKQDFTLFVYTDNRLYFDVGNGITSGRAYFSHGSVNNDWNNVVGVYDGTNVSIYLNNVKSANTGALTGDISRSCDVMSIGTYSGSTNYFDGSINDVRIYNRALNASEIKAYYDSTKHRYK